MNNQTRVYSKRIVLSLILIIVTSLPLFSACQTAPQTTAPEVTSEINVSSTDTAENNRELTDWEEATQQSQTLPGITTEQNVVFGDDAVQESVLMALPEDDADNISIQLYESDLYSLKLIKAIDYHLGEVFYVFEIINNLEDEIEVSVSNGLVNDRIAFGEQNYYVDPKETVYENLDVLYYPVSVSEERKLEKLSFDLSIESYQYAEADVSLRIDAEIPEELSAGLYFVDFFGARADEQVLLDNENARITLLFCGRVISMDNYEADGLTGLFCFENKSKTDMAVGIESIAINSISNQEFYGNGKTILPAGKSVYKKIQIEGDELESADVSSIYSISVLVAADTGPTSFSSGSLSGGEWYSLHLSKSGTQIDDEKSLDYITSEPVYSWEGIDIYYLYSEMDGYDFVWHFMVQNNSDRNVEFDISNVLINGIGDEEYMTALMEYPAFSGAGTRSYIEISMFDEEESEAIPDLAFNLLIYSDGMYTLLSESESIEIPSR